MPSDDQSSPPLKSSYPPLERPDFKPSVPAFLLENATEQDRYIIEQLSLVNQYAQWSVNTEMSTHEQVLRTNGKVLRAEADIKKTQDELRALAAKADLMEPLFKPLSLALRMWEYKAFRWATYLLVFFFFTYVLPYYLLHPLSLGGLWTLIFGT